MKKDWLFPILSLAAFIPIYGFVFASKFGTTQFLLFFLSFYSMEMILYMSWIEPANKRKAETKKIVLEVDWEVGQLYETLISVLNNMIKEKGSRVLEETGYASNDLLVGINSQVIRSGAIATMEQLGIEPVEKEEEG